MDNAQNSYQALFEHWKKSESLIKQVEHVSGKISIPSINENRCAGFHLITAISKRSKRTPEEELDDTLRHLRRSIRDSLEIGIESTLNRIYYFLNEYSCIPKYGIIDDYPEKYKQINTIQQIFIRNNRYEEGNENYLKEAEDAFEFLITFYSEDLLLKKELFEERYRSYRKNLHFKIFAAIAGAAAIIALLFTIIDFFLKKP